MARRGAGAVMLGLALLLGAGTAQAQSTTFTYRELDRGSPTALIRKTLSVHGEGFVRLQREKSGGMIYGGERYFTFASLPKSSFDGGCEVRRAHASYHPVRRQGGAEPLDAKLKLNDVWFSSGFRRLKTPPADDGRDDYETRMDRACAQMPDPFDLFTARNGEAARRAMKVVDLLAAAPWPALDCAAGSDCPALVRKVLAGRLFHVEQWACGPLADDLPAGEVLVCQELRFSLSAEDGGQVGALRVRFHEGLAPGGKTRLLTLRGLHASEAHYVE